MDTFCFNFTIAHPNKNNNNYNKKMENLGILETAKKIIKTIV